MKMRLFGWFKRDTEGKPAFWRSPILTHTHTHVRVIQGPTMNPHWKESRAAEASGRSAIAQGSPLMLSPADVQFNRFEALHCFKSADCPGLSLKNLGVVFGFGVLEDQGLPGGVNSKTWRNSLQWASLVPGPSSSDQALPGSGGSQQSAGRRTWRFPT